MSSLKRRSVNNGNNSNTSSVVSGNLVNGQEYEGRLVYVADLGLQERSWGNESKDPAQKISLGIEIVGELVEFEDGTTKPKILWLKPFFTYDKMSEKGDEIKYYSVFEPTAKKNTQSKWDKQLGKPCNVVIEYGYKKDDKDKENPFDNIGSLTAIPKKYQDSVGEAVTEPCIGDADDSENECTKALYGLAKWVYDKRLNEDAFDFSAYDKEPAPEFMPSSGDDVPF